MMLPPAISEHAPGQMALNKLRQPNQISGDWKFTTGQENGDILRNCWVLSKWMTPAASIGQKYCKA